MNFCGEDGGIVPIAPGPIDCARQGKYPKRRKPLNMSLSITIISEIDTPAVIILSAREIVFKKKDISILRTQ